MSIESKWIKDIIEGKDKFTEVIFEDVNTGEQMRLSGQMLKAYEEAIAAGNKYLRKVDGKILWNYKGF